MSAFDNKGVCMPWCKVPGANHEECLSETEIAHKAKQEEGGTVTPENCECSCKITHTAPRDCYWLREDQKQDTEEEMLEDEVSLKPMAFFDTDCGNPAIDFEKPSCLVRFAVTYEQVELWQAKEFMQYLAFQPGVPTVRMTIVKGY